MITRGIREFVSRDWNRLRRIKDEYWAERISRLGAGEALRVADELRRQAASLLPAWPTEEDRREDLTAHVSLAERFRRAAAARRA